MIKLFNRSYFITLFLLLTVISCFGQKNLSKVQMPRMMYSDSSRLGRPFAKDPFVIHFKGRYLMYYSVPEYKDQNGVNHGWGIGIAESHNLTAWKRIGDINIDPLALYESKGFCAPSALVIGGVVHLFYQTYGNARKDAICHAMSPDGITFTRDITNPIFHPTGNWNCGRAIDAEVFKFNKNYFLFFATRYSAYQIQIQGVASASLLTSFHRNEWTQLTDKPILKPEYPWEDKCIEGAALCLHDNLLYMFYAGAYNNFPQQIGIAKSKYGVHWTKLSDKPFLSNGAPGQWNSSESGHPNLFTDNDGRTYLFYQGNNDKGKTWFLSMVEVKWNDKGPYLVR